MRSSFEDEDVVLLLKDISGLVEELPTEVREKRIQSGMHYCEMLPIEYKPSEEYMRIYESALKMYSQRTAGAIEVLARKILERKGENVVLVSLARAGTPIGVLLKRYIAKKYRISVPHYSISIIRGRGIDQNALDYILKRHKAEDIQFVDGWVGKGAISTELQKALKDYENISGEIAVVSDPAGITGLYGSREDFLIPSSCLNSTVSGLISRTFLRDDIIGPDDFHGAAYYENLKDCDRTYEFINSVEKCYNYDTKENADTEIKTECNTDEVSAGMREVLRIAEKYGIKDINLVKPGIGETTRVLLRRYPWRILINDEDYDSDEMQLIHQLAGEKNVTIIKEKLSCYRCVGIIKEMKDI